VNRQRPPHACLGPIQLALLVPLHGEIAQHRALAGQVADLAMDRQGAL